jgi:outer membrane lipoprotein-sorting protein
MSDLNHQPDTEQLNRTTDKLREVSIPTGPPAQLVGSTIKALQAAAQEHASTPVRPRLSFIQRAARYSAAAALVAAAVGYVLFLDRSASRVLAQVAEKVNQAQTVGFHVRQKSPNMPELEARVWLRDSALRYELADALVMIIDFDQQTEIELDTNRKIARRSNLKERLPAEKIKAPIDRLRTLGKAPADQVTTLGAESLDGVRCQVFEIKSTDGFPVGGRFKLWADATTSLPVRLEAGDAQFSVIFEKFRWDENLKDELFRVEIPAGYHLEELTPAVIQPGRLYYHQGSTALTAVLPDGTMPEVQFVPRATAPATYASDRSELTPDGRFVAIAYSRIEQGAYPPDRILLWDRTKPEEAAQVLYHRHEGEMQSWQFSPDGTRLYVVYWEQIPGQKGPPGRYGADIVDLATKQIRPVKLPRIPMAGGESIEGYFAAASADGSQYLVVGNGLYLATSEGELVRPLTPAGTRLDPRRVFVSPDGTRAVFARIEEDHSQRLCTTTLADGVVRELSADEALMEIRPRWSPDGRQIAYSCRSFAPNNPPFHQGTETSLRVIDGDGTGKRTLLTEKIPSAATGFELIGWR